ncbi:hypothetical protein Tco_0960013 [Tanacetum coccineum]
MQSSGIESEVQDESSRSGNDTDTDDADIRPIYEEEPMADTIEQTTSLLANNADLKAQIQEKVFAIAALKNDLRKLKGNSVDTKFAKTSVLGKPVLQSLRNQSAVRQPNAFKSERPQMSKQRTIDDSKPKPRSTNHSTRSLHVSKSNCVTIMAVPIADHSKNSDSFLDSKHFVCSTCHKCVFNANHDACITKLLKEVNSRAKIQSHKTRNSNNLVVDQRVILQNWRQIFTDIRISPNKDFRKLFHSCTSKVDSEPIHGSNVDIPNIHESKQTVPTGKILASCTSKDDSEPTHGSNGDISNIHECKQTLDVSAGTSNNVKPDNLRVWLLKKLISQKPVLKWIQN